MALYYEVGRVTSVTKLPRSFRLNVGDQILIENESAEVVCKGKTFVELNSRKIISPKGILSRNIRHKLTFTYSALHGWFSNSAAEFCTPVVAIPV